MPRKSAGYSSSHAHIEVENGTLEDGWISLNEPFSTSMIVGKGVVHLQLLKYRYPHCWEVNSLANFEDRMIAFANKFLAFNEGSVTCCIYIDKLFLDAGTTVTCF